jgi:hypothetical protein
MQIENVFTNTEIIKLTKLANACQITDISYKNITKGLHYNKSVSPFRNLIEPKIKQLIGNDVVVGGACYKECYTPYPLHFDTKAVIDYRIKKYTGDYKESSSLLTKHNLVLLIPLIEGKEFKTAIFDINAPLQTNLDYEDTCVKSEWCNSKNYLNVKDYDHLPQEHLEHLNKFSLIDEITWKLGSVFTWDRNKLHCSSNFAKYNVVKKMLVLFID